MEAARLLEPDRSSRWFSAAFVLLAVLSATVVSQPSSAATYQVGPGRTYETFQDLPALQGGDFVLVDGNATYPRVVFTQPGTSSDAAGRIVIKGIYGPGVRRPIISGDHTGRAVHFHGAHHYTFEGFEVKHADRGIYHQSDDLIVQDVVVDSCTYGILSAVEGSGSCFLQNSEFYACGDASGLHHQLYMDTDEANYPGSTFRMQFCYLHDAAGGHNVKSRAERNEIYFNWIEGAHLNELDLVGSSLDAGSAVREDADVVGNVLRKTGVTATSYVARFGGDGSGSSYGRYRFVNNTVLYNYRALRADPVLESVEMHNNVFYQVGAQFPRLFVDAPNSWIQGRKVAGQKNWVQQGVGDVPPEWTGTIVGTGNPGFADYAALLLCPTLGSALVDAGTSAPSGFPFANGLFPPDRCPPQRILLPINQAGYRQTFGSSIDIGAFEFHPDSCCVASPTTDVLTASWPLRFHLQPSYPNPIRSHARVRFTILDAGWVSVKVYDVQGRERATIMEGYLGPGDYAVPWDCGSLPSGLYQCTLQRGHERETRKMVLVR